MPEITIRQSEAPSRSKQAGPCWIRIQPATGDPIYAAGRERTITAEAGQAIRVEGKAVLRRATRVSTERGAWTLYATGREADTVTVSVGAGLQMVTAQIRGVSPEPPAAEDDEDGPAAQVAALRAAGWSVRKLAADLGVHRSTVYRWAAGAQRPNTRNQTALAVLAGA